ncbi:MAG: Holliday junction resolvase RuvX [Robiginitomaculum sp.]|nr:MAG: Holliday junction resolvase RuvX [Robiginitomaculum sp.]
MTLLTIDDLKNTQGAILGIDPGTKTFGLAVSDSTRLIATPIETIRRKKFTPDAQKILALYADRNCGACVIGFPINMDGSEGPRAQSVKDFALNLQNIQDIPIFFWDERLSTAAVTRTLLEFDTSRAKRAANVDKLAASYILQGVLDRLRA